MKKSILLSLLLLFGIGQRLQAQKKESWKQLVKEAEVLMTKKDYAEAADHYERAWRQKEKKLNLAFLAAENYYLNKDYRKAAELYQLLRDDAEDYPLLGLKYARSLKQDGQYARATEAFENFLNGYNGEGKAMLRDIISNEIVGCELGTQLPAQIDRAIELVFPKGINTGNMEFGPVSAPDGTFFFSSDRGDIARIYRLEERTDGSAVAKTPENFPVIQNGQYCHGSYSPDGERLYFTICAEENWDDVNTRCEIYCLTRLENGWSTPQRLPDYINAAGKNSTHPYAMFVGSEEWLIFSSNLEGGRGGMDLWYTKRSKDNPEAVFSEPVNLGPLVNTAGHEITPFYDAGNEVLYFSSNGHISIGGFDVFQTKGSGSSWSAVENTGMPYNSAADDYGFVLDVNQTGGYLVSNRPFGGEKPNTTNSDIFRFNNLNRRLALRGAVYDKGRGDILTGVQVDLYQLRDGMERLVGSEEFEDGRYEFIIEPKQTYKVECNKTGYEVAEFSFETSDPSRVVYGEAVFLALEATGMDATAPAVIATQPKEADPDPAEAEFLNLEKKEYSASGYGPDDKLAYKTNALRHRGDYFKVQVSATGKYIPSKYKVLESFGDLENEYLINAKMTRVIVGTYFDEAKAFSVMEALRKKGFPGAFVVKYNNGLRYGRINP